jgi:hypothetical protein
MVRVRGQERMFDLDLFAERCFPDSVRVDLAKDECLVVSISGLLILRGWCLVSGRRSVDVGRL